MSTHREEALKAIEHYLTTPEPTDELGRRLLRATLEYAVEQVRAIQEVKRMRKGKTAEGS